MQLMTKKALQKQGKLTLESIKETFKDLFDIYGSRLETRILLAFDRKMDEVKDCMDEQKSDIATMKDEIVGELKTIREEQVMLNGRSAKINKIEDQVEELQKIHPRGQHLTS